TSASWQAADAVGIVAGATADACVNARTKTPTAYAARIDGGTWTGKRSVMG
ncbi:MAG: hypothetical protein QOC88_1675, partial [Mycobacterium sp.]|nr:hypothetical protein [Mycobacterium sp.]